MKCSNNKYNKNISKKKMKIIIKYKIIKKRQKTNNKQPNLLKVILLENIFKFIDIRNIFSKYYCN